MTKCNQPVTMCKVGNIPLSSILHFMHSQFVWLSLPLVLFIVSCSDTGRQAEDVEAMQLMQGIWINTEGNTPSIMARGDSIYYPDSTSLPVRFWIYKDSLYMKGRVLTRYKIEEQSEKLLKLENQNGEPLSLSKASDNSSMGDFTRQRPYALNVFETDDADTTVAISSGYVKCSIHIEPSSDRVVKSVCNDDGFVVDNMYLDRAANVCINEGGSTYYTHSFRKQEFSSYVPDAFLSKSILRNVIFYGVSGDTVVLYATIGIPDAETCYVVEIRISRDGKVVKKEK